MLAKGIVRPRSGGKRSKTERLHPVSSLLLRNVISNCPIAIHPRWRSIRNAKKRKTVFHLPCCCVTKSKPPLGAGEGNLPFPRTETWQASSLRSGGEPPTPTYCSTEPPTLRRTSSHLCLPLLLGKQERLLRVLRINCSTDVVEKKITEENLSLPLGAGEGNRTPDLLITNQLLYRLSHASILFSIA